MEENEIRKQSNFVTEARNRIQCEAYKISFLNPYLVVFMCLDRGNPHQGLTASDETGDLDYGVVAFVCRCVARGSARVVQAAQ